jgi:hypothetical protein
LTSALIPPALDAEVTVAQLTPPLVVDELDEQAAPSSARALSPASANLCDDLTRILPVTVPIPIAAIGKPRYCELQEVGGSCGATAIRPQNA